MIIDATNLILGRIGTIAAKKALEGEEVHIVNAELAVITGNPKKIFASFKEARERGAPLVGPYFPKTPDRIVKRSIRGMLPYKKPRGREALARIKCYVGTPQKFKSEKMESPESMHISKTNTKYISIKQISKQLGAKLE